MVPNYYDLVNDSSYLVTLPLPLEDVAVVVEDDALTLPATELLHHKVKLCRVSISPVTRHPLALTPCYHNISLASIFDNNQVKFDKRTK